MLGVPVVTGMSSVDALESAHPYFVEEAAEQESARESLQCRTVMCCFPLETVRDLHRLDFQYQDWARESYTILNDIDENELKETESSCQPSGGGDAGELIRKLIAEREEARCR